MTLGKVWSDSIISSSRQNFRRIPRDEEKTSNEKVKSRTAIARLLVLAVFLFLLTALVRIQIFQGDYFRTLSEGNRVREIPIPAARGIIYDRNGTALVTNLPAYRLQNCNSGKCVSSVISKDQAIDLQTHGALPNEFLTVGTYRNYPYGEMTAHLLGYVSEVTEEEMTKFHYPLGDYIGRVGLEEQYDGILRGTPGKELVEVDALGKELRVISRIPAKDGENLQTGIDLNLQKIAYGQIKNKKSAVVVTDPRNGQVLALVSSPSFDPNVFTDLNLEQADRTNKIKEIFSDLSHPLFNRAIAGTYPPGSTFKIIAATAGLETGKITEATTITDPGVLVIGPYKFPNWKFLQDGGTQGVLNVVGAIKVSNDIFFYRTGEWVGIDPLLDWAKKFGLSGKLGIDLPNEASGVVPDAVWRKNNYRSWYLGDTYHVAIGQGDLLVTPLQMNFWTSAVANGGKICRPQVIASNISACRDLGISKKNLSLVREGMIAACSPGGTAWPLFGFKRGLTVDSVIPIGCKTGTAEFGDSKGRTHAWLTGYAPACDVSTSGKSCDATVAVTVLVEGGGEGSDVAAPIVKTVLGEYFAK